MRDRDILEAAIAALRAVDQHDPRPNASAMAFADWYSTITNVRAVLAAYDAKHPTLPRDLP